MIAYTYITDECYLFHVAFEDVLRVALGKIPFMEGHANLGEYPSHIWDGDIQVVNPLDPANGLKTCRVAIAARLMIDLHADLE